MKMRRVLVVVASVVAFVTAAGGAVGFAGIQWAQHEIDANAVDLSGQDTGGTEPSTDETIPSIQGPCKDNCNFLILGSDSRAGLSAKDQRGFQSDAEIGGYRSDTIMLVSLNGQTRHATIVSFPRDLLVDIPGYGQDKINAAFSLGAADGRGLPGGMALAAKTVAKLSGMPINHTIVIDLGGFEAVVDSVGKVPFCTPVELVDDPQAFGEPASNGGSGLQLAAGCHELDGPTALALVRARHVIAGERKDCISDFARISRQQQFMRALINKLVSPAMVGRVPQIVNAVTKQLTFSKGLKVTDAVDLAKAMKGVASGNADFRSIPGELGWADINGYRASVVTVTPDGRRFMEKLSRGEDLGDLGKELAYQAPVPAEIAVRVYDDASGGHAQNDVYDSQLNFAGFKVMATAAEPAGELAGSGTVILYQRGAEELGKVVAQYVPGVELQEAKAGQLPDDTDVAVVVDSTYRYKDPGEGRTPEVSEPCPFT